MQSIIGSTRSARRLAIYYRMRTAWKIFSERQAKDEAKYTDAILDFNNLGVLFNKPFKNERMGKRAKDLIYGFWTEEDIRIKLAAEMAHFDQCQVHGQVHISGKRNRIRYRRKKNLQRSFFPDLTFLLCKQKDKHRATKERNIETAAIEVKYIWSWYKHKDQKLKLLIKRDLDKLVRYCRSRLEPRFDSGYFFCVDETGKAQHILETLIANKKYKKLQLGYGVVVPEFTLLGAQYPRHLEKYNRGWERRLAYFLDCLQGRLEDIYFTRKRSKLRYEKDSSTWFALPNKPFGWVDVCSTRYCETQKKKQHLVILLFRPEFTYLVPKNDVLLLRKGEYCKGNRKEGRRGGVIIGSLKPADLLSRSRIEKKAYTISKSIRKYHRKYYRSL